MFLFLKPRYYLYPVYVVAIPGYSSISADSVLDSVQVVCTKAFDRQHDMHARLSHATTEPCLLFDVWYIYAFPAELQMSANLLQIDGKCRCLMYGYSPYAEQAVLVTASGQQAV